MSQHLSSQPRRREGTGDAELTLSSASRLLGSVVRACGLGRFGTLLCKKRHEAASTMCDENRTSKIDFQKLFPCHLPPRPSCLFSSKKQQGRRRAQRWCRRRAAWLITEYWWTCMSYFALGSPKPVEQAVRKMGPYRCPLEPKHPSISCLRKLFRLAAPVQPWLWPRGAAS
jgi:hypothetical protein